MADMRVRCGSDVAEAALRGELDVATEPEIGQALRALLAEHGQLRIDLSALAFADLAAVRLLRGLAAGAPGRVELHGARGQVARVLALTADLVVPS